MSISSTLVHRAEIEFHEAAEPLRPFVGCFWVVTAQPDATIRVVPDGSTSISIHLQKGHAAQWCLRGPLIGPTPAAPADELFGATRFQQFLNSRLFPARLRRS